MALTTTDRFRCWARCMRDAAFKGWPDDIVKADIRAAVDAIDDWADANQTSFNNALPEPYKTAATQAQKAILFAAVLMRRAGVFTTEEDG